MTLRMHSFGLVTLAFLGLAGCGGGGLGPSETTYFTGVGVSPETVAQWNVVAVEVDVSQDLSVSRNPQDRFPDADIVWWEDPDGDRRAQVAAIMRNAAAQSVADLRGDVDVRLNLTLRKFHALTPFARQNGLRGWHDVVFDVSITDLEGNEIAGEERINADIKAYQGETAQAAVAQGQTQKIRIARRVAQVLTEWMGRD